MQRAFALGRVLVEVAPVADAADDHEAPALQLQRQLGRGHHVPHCRRALEVGVATVARVVRELQLAHGVIADTLGQRQPLFQRRGSLAVGHPFGHGPRGAQHAEMSARRVGVVAQRGTTGPQTQCGGRHHRRASEPQACHQQPGLHNAASAARRTSTRQS